MKINQPFRCEWLAKISGTPEKTTPAHQRVGNRETSTVVVPTETRVGSTIQHELLLKVQNFQQNSRYISLQLVYQKALKTKETCLS